MASAGPYSGYRKGDPRLNTMVLRTPPAGDSVVVQVFLPRPDPAQVNAVRLVRLGPGATPAELFRAIVAAAPSAGDSVDREESAAWSLAGGVTAASVSADSTTLVGGDMSINSPLIASPSSVTAALDPAQMRRQKRQKREEERRRREAVEARRAQNLVVLETRMTTAEHAARLHSHEREAGRQQRLLTLRRTEVEKEEWRAIRVAEELAVKRMDHRDREVQQQRVRSEFHVRMEVARVQLREASVQKARPASGTLSLPPVATTPSLTELPLGAPGDVDASPAASPPRAKSSLEANRRMGDILVRRCRRWPRRC